MVISKCFIIRNLFTKLVVALYEVILICQKILTLFNNVTS